VSMLIQVTRSSSKLLNVKARPKLPKVARKNTPPSVKDSTARRLQGIVRKRISPLKTAPRKGGYL